MSKSNTPGWRQFRIRDYYLALLGVAVVVAIRVVIYPLMGGRLIFPFFYAAACFAAWSGGFGPGIVSLLLGFLLAMEFFVTPDHALYSRPVSGLLVHFLAGLVIVSFSASLRRARRRAEDSAQDALARQKQLEDEIVERRRSERRALEREQELSVILHSIGDAVIVADVAGCVQLMNPLAETLTGWSIAAALGQHLDQVFCTRIEFDRLAADAFAGPSRREEPAADANRSRILTSRDGRDCPIDESVAPLRDDQGNANGVVVVFRDITARRAAERGREEGERRKDEFLAMLAHELRNPLAPISGALHVLDMVDDDPETSAQARAIMHRQVDQLVRLVDDLLDVSRITRGKIELRRQPVELAEVVGRAIETARPVVDAQRHELVVNLPPEPVVLDVDPVRMAQVLGNLLNNAAKYTEPGGRIEIGAARDAPAVVAIHVRDNGLGMSPETLGRVFDLFVQERHSLDRSQGGLGIGLTLVRQLVELHGGNVEARSAGIGQGSAFIIHLPVMPTATHCFAGHVQRADEVLVARPQ